MAVLDQRDPARRGTAALGVVLIVLGGVALAGRALSFDIRQREFVGIGLPILGVGLGLFLVFGLFFEAVIGLNGPAVGALESVLAVGLVSVGVVILLVGAVNRRVP
jgi:hypothetical protein